MQLHAAIEPRPGRMDQVAFTFTELLVVLCVVAVLTLLSVSAVAHNPTSSDRAVCANNLRRLMQAWQMYADDYSGLLMAHYSPSPGVAWVGGVLDFSPVNSDNTSPLKLTNAAYAAIGPYVNSSLLFRCPADPSTLITGGGVPKLRVRSYSMNGYVGPISDPWSPNFQVMTKATEVSQPNRTFVLLEEHPASINDSEFVIDLAHVGASATIVDFPAYFHVGGMNLGMADGHVEYWQWSDARTMPPINGPINLNVASPNNPDVARLQAAASYLR
ncbi:MAG: hypothetical protein HY298_00750 [Verrucomicrobia bacterium]|nr:hypothetical protein [Verrucomicrobiota bacterium]